MEENDIFDLSVAKEENKFIKKALQLESEAFSDVLEEMKDFPWVGPLIKLGKVGKCFMDLKFVWKIGRFLTKSEDIEQEKKRLFWQNLTRKIEKGCTSTLCICSIQPKRIEKQMLWECCIEIESWGILIMICS